MYILISEIKLSKSRKLTDAIALKAENNNDKVTAIRRFHTLPAFIPLSLTDSTASLKN